MNFCLQRDTRCIEEYRERYLGLKFPKLKQKTPSNKQNINFSICTHNVRGVTCSWELGRGDCSCGGVGGTRDVLHTQVPPASTTYSTAHASLCTALCEPIGLTTSTSSQYRNICNACLFEQCVFLEIISVTVIIKHMRMTTCMTPFNLHKNNVTKIKSN